MAVVCIPGLSGSIESPVLNLLAAFAITAGSCVWSALGMKVKTLTHDPPNGGDRLNCVAAAGSCWSIGSD